MLTTSHKTFAAPVLPLLQGGATGETHDETWHYLGPTAELRHIPCPKHCLNPWLYESAPHRVPYEPSDSYLHQYHQNSPAIPPAYLRDPSLPCCMCHVWLDTSTTEPQLRDLVPQERNDEFRWILLWRSASSVNLSALSAMYPACSGEMPHCRTTGEQVLRRCNVSGYKKQFDMWVSTVSIATCYMGRATSKCRLGY